MKKIIFLLVISLVTFGVFAEAETKFILITDFAYYPKSSPVAMGLPQDDVSRFAPLDGFYSAVEARVTGKMDYKIPTPFGTNPLVKGNNVTISPALEISPVTLMPQFFVAFTPIAFLKFTASAKIGTGWDFIGIKGMGDLDSAENGYKSLTPFKNYFYEFRLSNLFQFDVGAIVPGDWTHVVMQASYDILYTGLTGVENGTPWIWQASGEKANGWNYYSQIILGYQMPLVLQTVGLQFELSGYYDEASFDAKYLDWNPSFMRVNINPICILKFNENHSLTIQTRFSSRRGFSSDKGSSATNFNLDYNGREWWFERIAFSYAYSF
ncbi:MAG: hypothetical protein UH788_09830 [Treponemataceae bacterium]|nr:hypothetical protein [Treponemataceae bacterium]